MFKTSIILFLFIGCFASVSVQGQDEFEWEEVELDSKIAYEYVTDFFFDHKQYLWISSYRGLYRVNGYSSKYYVFNPNASNSLVTNVIYNCYIDPSNQLWILTDNGIQKYHYETDDFELILQDYLQSVSDDYKTSCTSAIKLNSDEMLFGTKAGAIRYNTITGEFQFHNILEEIIRDGYSSNAHVLNLKEDKRDPNRVIVYTLDGFYYFLKNENRFEKAFEDPDIDLKWRRYPYKHLETIEKGVFFTAMRSVYFYDFAKKKYSEIEIPWKGFRPSAPNTHIRNFILLNDKLYISTIGHGVYEVDINNNNKARLLISGEFNHIAKDSKTRLWVAKGHTLLRSKKTFKSDVKKEYFLDFETFNVNRKSIDLDSSTLELRNFERNINGSIALINPNDKKGVKYAYQLGNEGTNWIPLTNGRKFELNKLPAGDSRLQFKAITKDREVKSHALQLHIGRFFYEEWWFKLLVFSTVLFFLASIYFLIQSRKREREKHKENMLHMELNSLRSQMNPHFLFNTLNSIKNYMLTKNPDEAGDYLTKFSQLIRCILENSKSQFLTLDQELKAINLYVYMEQLRFDDDFKYEINIDPSIDIETFKVAPMLIQPFIENAIWHGLMPKKSDRVLHIDLIPYDSGVKCIVMDNGIGREASQRMYENRNESKNSLGLKITEERIANINLLYNIKVQTQIVDLEEGGTQVNIFLPNIRPLS